MGTRGFSSTRRKIKDIRRNLGDNVRDEVSDGVDQTASEARSELLTGGQVWRGHLVSNLKAHRISVDEFRVIARTPYAAYVEFGTGQRGDSGVPPSFRYKAPAHTPQLTEEITEWVRTKPGFVGGFLMEGVDALGWAIAKNIADEGTNAHPYMRPAWFRTKPLMMRNVRLAVKRTVMRP